MCQNFHEIFKYFKVSEIFHRASRDTAQGNLYVTPHCRTDVVVCSRWPIQTAAAIQRPVQISTAIVPGWLIDGC